MGHHIDLVTERMEVAHKKVLESQGSTVRLPKAELDLLAQIEVARDLMMDTLRCHTDRFRLWEVFGGDCARISRIRAVLEAVQFSEMNRGDQRLPSCLSLCQSVEKVVVDLGDAEAWRRAQKAIQQPLQVQSPGRSTQSRASSIEVMQAQSVDIECLVPGTSRLWCPERVPAPSETAEAEGGPGSPRDASTDLLVLTQRVDDLDVRVQRWEVQAGDTDVALTNLVLQVQAQQHQLTDGRGSLEQRIASIEAWQTQAVADKVLQEGARQHLQSQMEGLLGQAADFQRCLASISAESAHAQRETDAKVEGVAARLQSMDELSKGALQEQRECLDELRSQVSAARAEQCDFEGSALEALEQRLAARLSAHLEQCAASVSEMMQGSAAARSDALGAESMALWSARADGLEGKVRALEASTKDSLQEIQQKLDLHAADWQGSARRTECTEGKLAALEASTREILQDFDQRFAKHASDLQSGCKTRFQTMVTALEGSRKHDLQTLERLEHTLLDLSARTRCDRQAAEQQMVERWTRCFQEHRASVDTKMEAVLAGCRHEGDDSDSLQLHRIAALEAKLEGLACTRHKSSVEDEVQRSCAAWLEQHAGSLDQRLADFEAAARLEQKAVEAIATQRLAEYQACFDQMVAALELISKRDQEVLEQRLSRHANEHLERVHCLEGKIAALASSFVQGRAVVEAADAGPGEDRSNIEEAVAFEGKAAVEPEARRKPAPHSGAEEGSPSRLQRQWQARFDEMVAAVEAISRRDLEALEQRLSRHRAEQLEQAGLLEARLAEVGRACEREHDALQGSTAQQVGQCVQRFDEMVSALEAISKRDLDVLEQRLCGYRAEQAQHFGALQRQLVQGLEERMAELQAARAQVADLRSEVVRLVGVELDQFKKAVDVDSIWSSFAHVGALLEELQRRSEGPGSPANGRARHLLEDMHKRLERFRAHRQAAR